MAREIVDRMVYNWGMTDVDWMGYRLKKDEHFSFHHLIIASREGGPFSEWNGAILNDKAGHQYLHLIEAVDPELFDNITSMLIDINTLRRLDFKIIREIDVLLSDFEYTYDRVRENKRKYRIKERYRNRDYRSLR